MTILGRMGLVSGLMLLIGALPGTAQEAHRLSLAYFGAYGVQPGFTVGTEWSLDAPTHGVARPRVGFFTWPRDHWTLLAGIDGALPIGKTRSSVTAGIDYFFERRILELAVDLGSGDLSPNRQTRHHIVPTIGYRIDWKARRPWFAQLSLGKRLSVDLDNAAIIVFSLGTIVQFEQD